MGQNVNENKAMMKVVIAINKKNVNENKAMTKVVIATRPATVAQRYACNDGRCGTNGRLY